MNDIRSLLLLSAALSLCFATHSADAHGSVVPEEDLCLIQIGYLKAHFKLYLPRTHRHKEFCEDVPRASETLFVMEYVHGNLGEMPIDFRVIRDVTGLGRFAKKEDVELIEDLDSVTVFHQPGTIEPDVFSVVQHFDAPGWYIGIVTAIPPDTGKVYTAVFPFEVGFSGFGYWPLFVGAILVLQFYYFHTSGLLSKFLERRGAAHRIPSVGVASLTLVLFGASAAQTEPPSGPVFTSKDATFHVTYLSRLEPIPINRIHSWVLHVETADGETVADAEISVTGGMPAHDHGLPTSPRVTQYLGSGDYLIEGLRFHMNGYWEVELEIATDSASDTVIIPLEL